VRPGGTKIERNGARIEKFLYLRFTKSGRKRIL
jgi:hypothetical protein